jgi:hypothetical protein
MSEEWNKTDELLPTTCGYILLWNKGVYIATALYWVGGWEHEAYIKANYTHWQPIIIPQQ